MTYYGAFYKSALYCLLTRIMPTCCVGSATSIDGYEDAQKPKKHGSGSPKDILGSSPTGPGSTCPPPPDDQDDKSRVTGDCYARICGSRRVKPPPTTRHGLRRAFQHFHHLFSIELFEVLKQVSHALFSGNVFRNSRPARSIWNSQVTVPSTSDLAPRQIQKVILFTTARTCTTVIAGLVTDDGEEPAARCVAAGEGPVDLGEAGARRKCTSMGEYATPSAFPYASRYSPAYAPA
jgi:hypothetical protein